jgi:hypothetical protein
MSTVIDTLRFSDKLQEGGFAPKQANALTLALSDELTEQLATKADITALKADIKMLEASIITLDDKFTTKFNYTMALIGLLVMLELIPMVGKIIG